MLFTAWKLAREVPAQWWLAACLILAVVLYHFHAVNVAVRERDNQWVAKVEKINQEAREQRVSTQAWLTATAEPRNSELKAQLDSLQKSMIALNTKAVKPTVMEKIFPANCVVSADKVAQANEGR